MMVDEKNIVVGKRRELAVFVLLAFVLAPVVTVAGIGGYGLLIWLLQ